MLEIYQLVNKPISSCCYIIYNKDINNRCIIIDPGSESNSKLNSKLNELQLIPEFIILTHEHFDHCWGVNDLRERNKDVKLICSNECNNAIQREKGNCSVFYDNKRAFVLRAACIKTQDINNTLIWNSYEIKFIPTPGHTAASISVIIEKNIFSGDAYIPGIKTITKLPTGNKEDQKRTENFFMSLKGFTFFPGHTDVYKYE